MATNKDEIKRTYPLPAYNYRVEIGGVAVGFAKIGGLDIAYDFAVYRESPTEAGKIGPTVMRMPTHSHATRLILEKGVVPSQGAFSLYEWIKQNQLNIADKKDVIIRLLDENGKAVISWKAVNAFPIKLAAPTFGADSKEVAIESMELIADAVFVEAA